MSLQYKFFMINTKDPQEAEDELNRFLRSVKAVNVKSKLVTQGNNSYWNLSVEYNHDSSGIAGNTNVPVKKSKVDYREILSDDDFEIFAKLRDWRKQVAEKEAIPVYTIFTNEQLAQIAQNRVINKAGLQEISRVGEARVKKYGDDVVNIVNAEKHKKTGEAEE